MSSPSALSDAPVLVVNLHRRFAGVSATILALVPVQQRERRIAVLDRGELGLSGNVRLRDLLRHGWRPPGGHAHRVWHARRAPDLALGLLFARVLRQPWRFVYTSPSPRRHGAVWRAIVNRADAIIAVSQNAASFLDRYTTVVPHGVDTEAFRPPADKRAAWQAGGLPGKYGIGVFGRIRPDKGTDLFVDAMIALLPKHPDFTAVVSGWCKPSDQPFRDELDRRIRAAGLEKRVVFLGDLTDRDIKLWYQRVCLCVAPSRSEGFGLTPLEAMASGAAAVTSREGGFPQMIVPGLNGNFFDTGNGAQLISVLEPLLADPEALMAMGARAREHVVARHAIASEVAGIHAVYDSLLTSGDGRSRS